MDVKKSDPAKADIYAIFLPTCRTLRSKGPDGRTNVSIIGRTKKEPRMLSDFLRAKGGLVPFMRKFETAKSADRRADFYETATALFASGVYAMPGVEIGKLAHIVIARLAEEPDGEVQREMLGLLFARIMAHRLRHGTHSTKIRKKTYKNLKTILEAASCKITGRRLCLLATELMDIDNRFRSPKMFAAIANRMGAHMEELNAAGTIYSEKLIRLTVARLTNAARRRPELIGIDYTMFLAGMLSVRLRAETTHGAYDPHIARCNGLSRDMRALAAQELHYIAVMMPDRETPPRAGGITTPVSEMFSASTLRKIEETAWSRFVPECTRNKLRQTIDLIADLRERHPDFSPPEREARTTRFTYENPIELFPSAVSVPRPA